METKIYTPTLTIFNSKGEIDIEKNKKLINYLVDNGVDGLVPLGSSGEFTNLNFEQRLELLDLYISEVDGRVDIIAGTGTTDLNECLKIADHLKYASIKGLLILPPYYYAISQEEAFRHYNTLASNINKDIYIYNFPARTGFDMAPSTVLKLLNQNKNIKGMKDSTSNFSHTEDVLKNVLPEYPSFEMYSGFDNHFLPNYLSGGSGCIAAISNFVPKFWSEIIESTNNKKFDKLLNCEKVMNKLMETYDVQSNFSLLFKFFLQDAGLDINTYTCFPFDTISEEELESGRLILKEAKMIYDKEIL